MMPKLVLHKLISRGSAHSSSSATSDAIPSKLSKCPVEIILEILTYAASSSQGNAYNIALVASWTFPLAQKALYRTVVLTAKRTVDTFISTLAHSHRSMLSTRHIKGSLLRLPGKGEMERETVVDGEVGSLVSDLWLPSFVDRPRYMASKAIDHIFDSCSHLRRVAIPGGCLRSLLRSRSKTASALEEQYGAVISDLTLNSVAFRYDWTEYIGTSHGQSFLNNLTHLWVFDMSQSSYLPLTFLPNLTHLAVPLHTDVLFIVGDLGPSALFQTSDSCLANGSMCMLVYHVTEKLLRRICHQWPAEEPRLLSIVDLAAIANEKDERIYVTKLGGNVDGCPLWENCARECGSIWESALQTVQTSRELRERALHVV